MINPIDAKKKGFKNGDIVQLLSRKKEKNYPIVIRKNISQGFVLLNSSNGHLEFEYNPCAVKIRREHV